MAADSKAVALTDESQYQLDTAQTIQACKVLLRHIADEQKRVQADSSKPNLLAKDPDDSDDDAAQDSLDLADIPIWLVVSTKKHISSSKRLKPSKVTLPHPINTSELSTICIITADPQSTYTTLFDHPTFPTALRSRITRIISLTRLKKDHKSFEARRKLLSEHDTFLADDRIVTYLPGTLGKVFYKGSTKRPIPISLSPARDKDETAEKVRIDPASGRKIHPTDKVEGGRGACTPVHAAKEIEKALQSALVNLAPATTTAIKAARADFTSDMLRDNVHAVVDELATRFIPQGWKNVRAIHIKGPNSMAFPIWLASELWVDEEDVLEEKNKQGNKGKSHHGKDKHKGIKGVEAEVEAEAEEQHESKRKSETTSKPDSSRHAKKKRRLDADEEEGAVAEKSKRKEKLKKQKAQALAESI